MKSFFHFTTQITPLENETTQFAWITTYKFWNLQETTEEIGFYVIAFCYYTQITPLENGDHTVRILKQWVLWSRFSIITQINSLENGTTQLEWITSKSFRNLHETTKAMISWERLSIITHKSHPWKTRPHSLNGLQPANFEICTKPLRILVLWGRFSIINSDLRTMDWHLQIQWIQKNENPGLAANPMCESRIRWIRESKWFLIRFIANPEFLNSQYWNLQMQCKSRKIWIRMDSQNANPGFA